jgi:hypothetical protein
VSLARRGGQCQPEGVCKHEPAGGRGGPRSLAPLPCWRAPPLTPRSRFPFPPLRNRRHTTLALNMETRSDVSKLAVSPDGRTLLVIDKGEQRATP